MRDPNFLESEKHCSYYETVRKRFFNQGLPYIRVNAFLFHVANELNTTSSWGDSLSGYSILRKNLDSRDKNPGI